MVVPSRDRRELLSATLESLMAQTVAPAEVVVVSDGSTDGTDDMVRHLAERSDRIRLLRTNGIGPGGARNAGWRAVNAGVIAFLDDDCVASPGWLAAVTEPFHDPVVGIVQGTTLPAGPVGRYDRTIRVVEENGLYESCNVAYRREALEAVGGFDESFGVTRAGPLGILSSPHFGEDTDLAWRVKRAGWASRFSEQALVHHHVFRRGYLGAVRQEWSRGLFPYLIREIPELRDRLPGGRLFMRRHSPQAQLALFALLGGLLGRRRAAVILAAPYALWVTRGRSPAEAAEQTGRDLVGSAGLLVGSLWYRRCVL